MTFAITTSCISCQRCVAVCPTGAVQSNGIQVWIDNLRCNHCAGSFSVPQCWATCPTNDGCVAAIAPTTTDYWASWFATYTQVVDRLQSATQPQYWNTWFDRYAQTLAQLQQRSAVP